MTCSCTEIIPLYEVRKDIREMVNLGENLKYNIYPHLKGRLPWRFIPFWGFLWGLIIHTDKAPFIMGFCTMWSALYFLKHCAIALGCLAHIKQVDERIIGLNEYIKQHYPNEEE